MGDPVTTAAAGAAVGEITKCALALLRGQVDCLCDYRTYVAHLEGQVRQLQIARLRIDQAIQEANEYNKKIKKDVQDWLRQVNDVIIEAGTITRDERQAQKCLHGFCANLMSCCLISRKAIRLDEEIGKLLKETFTSVSYTARSEKTWNTRYEAFQSRTVIMNNIMELLTDANINMIGVYGQAGVGKTTLVKEIGRQAEEKKLFDRVVMVSITRKLDMRRIQEEIAELLNIKLDRDTDVGRAQIISELINEKRILVILDDLWEGLELEKIGLHLGICKILMTSRHEKVLKGKMGCPKNFMLNVLEQEETLSFFKKVVGEVEDSTCQDMESEIAKNCGGLPVLVVTVASNLRGRNAHTWVNIMKSQRNYEEEGMQEYNACLMLSYNELDDDEKKLFMLCGMVGAEKIDCKDLLRYVMGLRLFRDVNTIKDARDRLHSLVDNLKDFCWLQPVDDDGEHVKMHDFVRHFAIFVASRDQHVLSVADGDLKESHEYDFIRKCTMISLSFHNNLKLPKQLSCPKLKMLLLYCNDKSPIPQKLFKRMKGLKVLDLRNFHIQALPASLSYLKNLQTLCLAQCVLQDISLIGKLRNLEMLSFAKSDVKELPSEVLNLTCLRSLDLRDCSQLEVISPNVLSSLTRLEELNMKNSFNKWEVDHEGHVMGRNARLSELKNLSFLTTLDIHVPDATTLPPDLFSDKFLLSYNILIGHDLVWDGLHKTTKSLKVKLTSSHQLDEGPKRLLNSCEDLYLDVLEGVNDIVYQLTGNGFPKLKHLHIQNTSETTFIVNSIDCNHHSDTAVFPILESLLLHDLVRLESVCYGQPASESFRKLKIIKVQSCHGMRNLFSSLVARFFSQLEEMEVADCKTVNEIIVSEEDDDGYCNEAFDPIKFSQLRTLTLQSLPKLLRFSSRGHMHTISSRGGKLLTAETDSKDIVPEIDTDSPLQLFNREVEFPKLKVLKISSVPSDKLWHDRLSPMPFWIQNLTSLIVEGCDSLRFLLSFPVARILAQLKHLEICRCRNMVEILSTGQNGEHKTDNVFSKLESLKISTLQRLSRFCLGSHIEFPLLKKLDLSDCSEVGEFIFNPLSKDITGQKEIEIDSKEKLLTSTECFLFNSKARFPSLEQLSLSGLNKMTTIWHGELSPTSFCKLKDIRIQSCKNLVNIFVPCILTRLHHLETIKIEACSSLQAVFELRTHDSEGITDVQGKNVSAATRNLHSVIVHDCGSLKNLFPASLAKHLQQLQELIIENCGVEEIVFKEDASESIAKFTFPKVINVSLLNLPLLKAFYPGPHSSKWLALKDLKVSGCDNVKILAADVSTFEKNKGLQPLFPIEKGPFPHLKNLMKEIRLYRMPKLMHLWKENSQPTGPVFPNVQVLIVREHKNLASSEILFQNITTLEVSECHGLKSLLTYSIAKSLKLLTRLVVTNCKRMTEIVKTNRDGAGYEFNFAQLVYMEFSCLPRLKAFSAGNCTFKFPSLSTLVVEDCIEMQISPDGILPTDPKLRSTSFNLVEEEEEEEEEEDDDYKT